MTVLPCRRCGRPVEAGTGTCPYCGRVNPHQEETAPHGFLILLATLRHRFARRIALGGAVMVVALVAFSAMRTSARRRAAPHCSSAAVISNAAAILHENAVDGLPRPMASSVFSADRFVVRVDETAGGGATATRRECAGTLQLALDSATVQIAAEIVEGRIRVTPRATETVTRHWRRATEQLEIPVKYVVGKAVEAEAIDLTMDEQSAIAVRDVVEALASAIAAGPPVVPPKN